MRFIFIVFFLFPFALNGQTLKDALENAYNNSDLLEQNRALLQTKDEDYVALGARLKPVISYAFSPSNTSVLSNPLDTTNNLISTISLSAGWKLFDFGITKISRQNAALMVASMRQTLVNIEQTVLLNAARAYFLYQSSLENFSLTENNVRLIHEHLEAARERFALGRSTQTDIAQAEARLAQAEAQKVVSHGNVVLAAQEYKLAIGITPPKNLASIELARLPFASEKEAIELAVTKHPIIKAQQLLIKANERLIEISDKAWTPSVELSATISDDVNDSSEGFFTAGLKFSGTIYNGGAFLSAKRKIVAQHSANMANLHLISKQTAQQATNAWSNYKVAQQSLKAAQEGVRANEIAYKGVQNEVELGLRTTLDALNAEQELLNSKTSLVNAKTSLNIAYYSVLSAAGRLTTTHQNLDVLAYSPDENFINHAGQKLDDVLYLDSEHSD